MNANIKCNFLLTFQKELIQVISKSFNLKFWSGNFEYLSVVDF
jgi:hypothetical protein